MIRTSLLLLCLLVLVSELNAQQRIRNAVHLGTGPNYHTTLRDLSGCGAMWNAGWSRTDKSGRARFSPDVTFSSNQNDCIEDTPFSDFNSLTARAIYNYDFIQTYRFAAFIGGGTVINWTDGNFNRNGPDPGINPQSNSSLNLGLTANIGLRFLPLENRRLGFEIVPVNLQFAFKDYSELFILARFFYVLDGRRRAKPQTK